MEAPLGLTAWWKAENSAEEATLLVPSNVSGGVAYDQGIVGKAFVFDGVDGALVGEAPSLSTPRFSVSTWLNTTSAVSYATIVCVIDGTTPLSFDVSMSGTAFGEPVSEIGRVRATLSQGPTSSPAVVRHSATVADGKWHHIVLTYDGTRAVLYVDGIAGAPISLRYAQPTTNAVFFAGNAFFENRALRGKIDEIAIFNRALTPLEVASLHGAVGQGFCMPTCRLPADLIGWWRGERSARDTAGINDGVVNLVSYGEGVSGQALSFLGRSSYLRAGDPIDGNREGTIQMWFKARDWNWRAGEVILWSGASKEPPNGSFVGMQLGSFSPESGTGEILFGIYQPRWNWARSNFVPETNRWYHVVGTWGSAGIKLYIDGVLRGHHPATNSPPNTYKAQVLGGSSWPNVGFNGFIDEFAIFSRAFGSNEVRLLFEMNSKSDFCRSPNNFDVPPSIVHNPMDLSRHTGETASFAVYATGTAPLKYAWLFNGNVLESGTNASLNITNVQREHAGSYKVRVSNALGTVDSAPAQLAVTDALPPPAISILFPTNGQSHVPPTAVLAFSTIGINPDNPLHSVKVTLNGVDVSGRLSRVVTDGIIEWSLSGFDQAQNYEVQAIAITESVASTNLIRFDTHPKLATVSFDLVRPTNGASFHPYSEGMQVNVSSAESVDFNRVKFILNGIDVTHLVGIAGDSTSFAITFSNLAPYTLYQAQVVIESESEPAPTVSKKRALKAEAGGNFGGGGASGTWQFDTRVGYVPLGCDEKVRIKAYDEYFHSSSDALASIWVHPMFSAVGRVKQVVGVLDAFENRCAEIDFAGIPMFSMEAGSTDTKVSWETFLESAVGLGVTDKGQFSWNEFKTNIRDIFKDPPIGVAPCNLQPIHRVDHLGGELSATAIHAGSGRYPRKTRSAEFRICREFIIEANSSRIIELPLTLSGHAYADGTFAIAKSHVKATLSLSGKVAGSSVSLADGLICDTVESLAGSEKHLSAIQKVIVVNSAGIHRVAVDLAGAGVLEVQAHGSGQLASIAAAVTGSLHFPNSIEVAMFTGANGGALPPGVRITDASSGAVVANTLPYVDIVGTDDGNVILHLGASEHGLYRLEVSKNLNQWERFHEFVFTGAEVVQSVPVHESAGFFRLIGPITSE